MMDLQVAPKSNYFGNEKDAKQGEQQRERLRFTVIGEESLYQRPGNRHGR